MRATRQRALSTTVLLMGGLPLVLAASCSFQRRTAQGPAGKETKEVFVANAFCGACHYGFAEENLASTHEKGGIGCERCHGESERHRSDEDNVTPPEIMYPRDKINPTCMMCHPRHEIRHVASHKAWLAGAKTSLDPVSERDDEIVCTDCHAKEHRITVRTIRWNKATGERIKQ